MAWQTPEKHEAFTLVKNSYTEGSFKIGMNCQQHMYLAFDSIPFNEGIEEYEDGIPYQELSEYEGMVHAVEKVFV